MTPLRTLALMAVVALATAAACAPVTVTLFTESSVDLARYRTYGWGEVEGGVPGDPRLDNNPFFHDYLRGAIDRHLRTRGYEQTAMVPDLRVHYHASATQRISISGTEPAKLTCRDCGVQVYDEGTVLIDLVDARSGALVWRGSTQTDIAGSVGDQTRMESTLERVVARILAQLRRPS
jgi:hypothetical protein